MAMGKICPICRGQTFHNKGSHHACNQCDFIGWGWNQPVTKVGSGRGVKCPNCNKQTLHTIVGPQHGMSIFRCSICDYAGVGRQ